MQECENEVRDDAVEETNNGFHLRRAKTAFCSTHPYKPHNAFAASHSTAASHNHAWGCERLISIVIGGLHRDQTSTMWLAHIASAGFWLVLPGPECMGGTDAMNGGELTV